ncbi:MAG: gluconate:H+ symporter [Bacteroidota bacterium]
MSIYIVLLGVVVLLLLIAVVKLNAFLSFIIVSLGVGAAVGMDLLTVVESVQKGIGNTLGFLVLILGLGAMLGKIVAESGAAQRITGTMVSVFGTKRVQLALVLTGFIVGIPMFYSVGFVILVPLVFSIAASTGLPLLYVGLPMLASLSVTHGYLPPHPAPTAIVETFGADIGLTMIYGIIVAIPAIIVAGPVFSQTLKKYRPTPPEGLFDSKPKPESELPGIGVSLFAALLPIILIAVAALASLWGGPDAGWVKVMNFLGNPAIAMLIAVLVAAWLLGIRQGEKMEDVMATMGEGVKSLTLILLVIAGAGALKQVLSDSGVSQYIAEQLIGIEISPLVLAWGIASIIRVCVGSATVAGLTTAGIIAPFVATSGASPELMVLATGAGSLMFSHVNDSGFWMFKEFFNLTLKETLSTWSVMETIVSVMGLLGALVLSWLI